MHILSIIAVFIILAIPVQLPASAATEQASPVIELQAWLVAATGSGQTRAPSDTAGPLMPIARFYRQAGFQPVWYGPEGLLPHGEILLSLMTQASEAGLFPADYRPSYLETITPVGISLPLSDPMATLPSHIRVDMMLTAGILRYAQDLYRGRIAPETLSRIWPAWRRPGSRDIPAELANAVNGNRLAAYIESLHPGNRAYQGLRRALEHYTWIQRNGGWPSVAPGATLRPGDTGERVEDLQRRLAISADLPGDASGIHGEYDNNIEAAVKQFQRRHGLQADGLVGKRTLAVLNIPVAQRITELMLNMERKRWLPDDLGRRHLMVNIPAFEMRVVEEGSPTAHMRIIVGRKQRQTPIMSARMTYLELNPYWNIPQKIARKDILPKVIRDPDYLTRQGIRVYDSWDDRAQELDPTRIAWNNVSRRYFPYRLRQDPSDRNALGRVKFMFPNFQSIYIHDTPGKALFNRQNRSFSSGCVRVQAPMTLAHYLLDSQGWDRDRLDAAVSRGQRKTVLLDNPIPVHLLYFTAWVDDQGLVNFREDIYGRDRQLLLALTRRDADAMTCDAETGKDRMLAHCVPSPPAFISTVDTPPLELAGEVADNPMPGL